MLCHYKEIDVYSIYVQLKASCRLFIILIREWLYFYLNCLSLSLPYTFINHWRIIDSIRLYYPVLFWRSFFILIHCFCSYKWIVLCFDQKRSHKAYRCMWVYMPYLLPFPDPFLLSISVLFIVKSGLFLGFPFSNFPNLGSLESYCCTWHSNW